MIFITGDCHRDYRRFNTTIFPEQREMTKEDYVIICGDFGYWLPDKEQDHALDWLAAKPFTTLFIDGNHEYFRTNEYYKRKHRNKYDLGLMDYPVEEWHGGKVHKINDSVFHLMRGQIFEINGRTFFTFGGARSHDIQDGVLDPFDYGGPDTKAWKDKYHWMLDFAPMFRVRGWSWWDEEMASEEEFEEGRRNLREYTGKIDFILSHEGPASAVAQYSHGLFKVDKLSQYLQEIDESVEYKKHIFGHYHDNVNIDEKHILIFEEIIRIQ